MSNAIYTAVYRHTRSDAVEDDSFSNTAAKDHTHTFKQLQYTASSFTIYAKSKKTIR